MRNAFRTVVFALAAAVVAALPVSAQTLGWEGPTGTFITPVAYVATSQAKSLGRPVVGYHFLAGGPVVGDFSTVNFTEGFAKRFEAGYTSEVHAAGDAAISANWEHDMSIVHGKAQIVDENAGHHHFVPAISLGGIYRFNDHYSNDGVNGQTTSNGDIYLVATKTITETKIIPIVLTAGVRGTNAALWGLAGNASEWTPSAFGSAAFVFKGPATSKFALGAEIEQQPNHALATAANGVQSAVLNFPTSESYAIRIFPSAKYKLNLDAGVLHSGNYLGQGVKIDTNARVAFAISYGF